MEAIYSVADLERVATRSGSHFFSPSAKRFFSSRIGGELFGGRYFITSEQQTGLYGENIAPRRYTIRTFTIDPSGYVSIDTIGEFQQYHSRAAALVAVAKLLKADN